MILKADHAVSVSHEVFLVELHGRVRFTAVARIDQPDRLHRSIAQGVDATARKFLDRKTRFEPARLFESLERDAVRFKQSLVETRVLLFVKRAVEIIVSAFAITRRAKSNSLVH